MFKKPENIGVGNNIIECQWYDEDENGPEGVGIFISNEQYPIDISREDIDEMIAWLENARNWLDRDGI
jgi:hypothetical protein